MKFTTSLTSFKSGRLSPKLFNRVDTAQYKDGASELKCMRPIPEGGIDRCKGYRHIKTEMEFANLQPQQTKLFSFTMFGRPITVALYLLSDNRVILGSYKAPYEFVTDGLLLQIVEAGAKAYDVSLFDWAVINNTLILTHYDGDFAPLYIEYNNLFSFASIRAYVGDRGWDQNANSNLYSFDPVGAVNLPTYFPMSDIGENQNILTLSNYNPVGPTIDVTSTDADTVTLLQSIQYLYMEGLGRYNFGGGDRTFVASEFFSVVTNIANGVRVRWFYSYYDGVNYENMLTFGGITSVSAWAYSLWKEGDFPRTVTTHEGRVVFGGTPSRPMTLFGSKVNNPNYFNQLRRADPIQEVISVAPPSGLTTVTDPYVFTIATKEDSAITFLQSSRVLIIGTDRKEYIGSGGDSILSPLSVNIKPQTAYGSMPLRAGNAGSGIYFISSNGKQLFKFKFNDANGSFVSQEVSLLFSDLLENDTIKTVEWAPHISTVMILMASGKLYGVVDNPQSEVLAFYDTGLTLIDEIAFVAQRADYGLYFRGDHLIMYRSGEGLLSYEQQYYEYGINDSYVKKEQLKENQYLMLDKVIKITRTAPNTFDYNGLSITNPNNKFPIPTGFGGLFGNGNTIVVINEATKETKEIVVGLADLSVPFPAANIAVTNGPALAVVTRDFWSLNDNDLNGADTIIIGEYPAAAEWATMPVEAGQQWGSAQMGVKNIDTLGIRFYNSYSLEVSSDSSVWENVVLADKLGKAATGRAEKKFSASPRNDMIVYMRNTKAEPVTLTGLNMKGVSNDG